MICSKAIGFVQKQKYFFKSTRISLKANITFEQILDDFDQILGLLNKENCKKHKICSKTLKFVQKQSNLFRR